MSSKFNKKLIFATEFKKMLAALIGKPALLSAIIVAAVFASLDASNYAFALLLPIIVINHFVKRNVQWIIFISIAIAIISHEILLEQEPITQINPANFACGIVESTQQKSSGLAIIVNVKNELNENNIASFANYRVRITEKRSLLEMPSPGDSLCYEASWYPITPPTVEGAFDTKSWLKSQSLSAYGKFLHWTIYSKNWTFERSFCEFRKWISERFSKYLDKAETGLLLGLLAGDRSGIPDALRSDFQRSGLVHVLAISGFHVVLLAGMLMIFLKATGLPHRIVRLLAIALLLLYVPVTGGSPAVRRAVLMFSVPQIGALFERDTNTLNSLGVALLLIMLFEPDVIWNPGFQLSVAATLGILMSNSINPLNKLPDELSKNKLWSSIQHFIFEPTYITLCATLFTAPFLIHHFKTLSPFAWLGNIVVVPAISMGMQAGLFALISPIDFFRENFCYAARFFLRLASLLTRILSDSPQASITVGPFSPPILLICGFVIVTLPLINKNKIVKIFIAISALIFATTFAISGFSKAITPSWSLSTIDVGQGDSHLITTPSGNHILVDAGDNARQDSGKDIIIPYLHSIGVSHLDALIITHADQDHFGGAMSIIKTFPVKELWITDCAMVEPKDNWLQIITEAYGKNIKIRDVAKGFMYKENLFEIKVLHPDTRRCVDVNTQSITFRAKGLGHSVILTGDLTVAGEKDIAKTDVFLKSDVLKLGHHGSKTSSSKDFLNKVSPKLAIISSGRKNRFRHPSKQIIARLDSLKIPYLNTAQKGSIKIEFTSDTLLVNSMIK